MGLMTWRLVGIVLVVWLVVSFVVGIAVGKFIKRGMGS